MFRRQKSCLKFYFFYLRKRLVFLFKKPEIWVNKVAVVELKTAVGSSSPDAPGHSSLTNLGRKNCPKLQEIHDIYIVAIIQCHQKLNSNIDPKHRARSLTGSLTTTVHSLISSDEYPIQTQTQSGLTRRQVFSSPN